MIDSVSNGAGAPPDLKRTRRNRAGFSEAPKIDRLPPQSIEAEQGVLGCILLSPNTCLAECVDKFRTGGDVFYDLRHQTIFDTLVWMFEERRPIDMITLQQTLKDDQRLEEVGGLSYLTSLPDSVPSAANLGYYLDIVTEKHTLRRVIQTCTEAIGRVYEHEGDVEGLMDGFESEVLKIRMGQRQETRKSMRTLIPEAIQRIEAYTTGPKSMLGLSSGLADLDTMTGGFVGGGMYVFAARPSMGKTSLVMNMAEHVATALRLPVGVFSLEMTGQSLAIRMLCSRARVNFKNIRDGFISDRDYPKLTHAAGQLSGSPINIDDEGGLSITQLRAKARRMVQELGTKLMVVDYLQLLHANINGRKRIENRQQEVAEISGGIKAMAKELDVPVIVLSQLNRDLDKREGQRPTLADLRESGAIEQDADLVAFLYKPPQEKNGTEDENAVPVNLLVAKQREGPTGAIPLTFLKSITRFEMAAKVSDGDVPMDSQGTML